MAASVTADGLPEGKLGTLNGMDETEMAAAIAEVRTDPARAERHPRLVAEWVGADRSRARISGKTLEVNGPGQMDPMQLVLAALASCEIDVIVTHATLMGVAIEALEVHVDAHFDVRTYLGLDGPPPGYDRLSLEVRLRAPGITQEQIRRLQDAIERYSPVGATLTHGVRFAAHIRTV